MEARRLQALLRALRSECDQCLESLDRFENEAEQGIPPDEALRLRQGALAERLRHALEEHRFPRAGRVSCSAGVASTPRDGLDATELLEAAEQALGLAKKSGRHRTAASGPAHAN